MIVVEPLQGNSIAAQQVEIVERKGTGHPDFMCDAMMEAICLALCREYRRKFGTILHHNIDKGLLSAGQVAKRFGGGEVVRPMELVIGDRAALGPDGTHIPVEDIAVEAARTWMSGNLRLVDPERHLRCRVLLSPGSEELADIFTRKGRIREANDTSAAVGFYPFTLTEQVVLDLERFLNGTDFKGRFPYTGEDVKVMGLRRVKDLDVTVAMPLLAPFIGSEDEYFSKKRLIVGEIEEFLGSYPGLERVSLGVNTLDGKGRGLAGVYLSLLGTSAEDADSGQVGRGNRVNGLISVNRPMGTEAAAGKNPVSHVGKIYNVLAHLTAEQLCRQIEGVREAYVFLVSRIGAAIDRPQMAYAQLLMERGSVTDKVRRQAKAVVDKELAQIGVLCDALADGVYPVC